MKPLSECMVYCFRVIDFYFANANVFDNLQISTPLVYQ